MMKKKGSKFEYERERDDALFNAYRTALSQCTRVKKVEIYRVVARMPSPRFWVSPERATIVISRMLRGDELHYMTPLKRKMFREIYDRYVDEFQKRPEESVYNIVFDIVHQQAPSFYLTPGSVKTILCRIKAARHKRNNR